MQPALHASAGGKYGEEDEGEDGEEKEEIHQKGPEGFRAVGGGAMLEMWWARQKRSQVLSKTMWQVELMQGSTTLRVMTHCHSCNAALCLHNIPAAAVGASNIHIAHSPSTHPL